MQIEPRETVILATRFNELMEWYRDVLGFEVNRLFEDDYHYCYMVTPSGIRIGIADATEMGIEPEDRSKNTVVMQVEVDDVKAFFGAIQERGGSVTFGPSFDKSNSFWFGGIADPEGNPIWVVDRNCP